MSNRDYIISLVKAISGNANMLSVPRLFVDLTGDLTMAAMLSQLIYWSDRSVRKDGLVYKSSTDWRMEVGASRYAVNKFNTLPYIETQIKMANGHPTNHYKVLLEVLVDHLERLFDVDVVEIDHDSIGAKLPPIDNDETSIGAKLPPLDSDESGIEAKLPLPLSEIEQCTVRNHTDHCLKSNNPLSEIEQSITEITTETTTDITTETTTDLKDLKELKDFSANAEFFSFSNSEIDNFEGEENENTDLKESDHSNYHSFFATLSKITGLDESIKSNAGRLGRASSQLIKAGYTIPDLNGFLGWWMDNDWRWKKSKLMPTPENVLSHIAHYKNSNIFEDYNRRRYEQWLKKI